MKFRVSRATDAHKKKSTQLCSLSVVFLLYKYKMLPGSIFVLPIDSPLFSVAFVRFQKEEILVFTAAVNAM